MPVVQGIAIGDRFMKTGTFHMPVWRVASIQTTYTPPHAHLLKEGNEVDTLTISIPALNDETLFRRLPS